MSEPRHINTNRSARSQEGTSGARHINRSASGAGTQPSGSVRRTAGSTSRPAGSTSRPAGSVQPSRAGSAGGKTGRKKKKKIPVWMPLLVVLCVIGVGVGVVLGYVNSVFQAIRPDSGAAAIADEVKTAPEFQGDVVNVLVAGIDYEEGRTYSSGDAETNDGMTDMIMYFQFDVKQGKVNMLQIPRNTVVGSTVTCSDTTGNTYKASNGQINSIAKSNDEGIAALADVISNNYKLPVDYYATIDMDALKEIVDRFGGLNVYVPQDIDDGRGSKLEAGYHTLTGEQVEFLVRNRHGDGYSQGDINRLNTQRYFYSALFKRVRTANLAELWKLLPVVTYYVKTDMPGDTIIALAYKFLSVDSSDIMVAQTPVYNAAEYYNGNSVVVPAANEIADLLNSYYRTYMDPVSASELNLFDWATTGSPTDANVQFMGELDAEREQAISEGNTDVMFDY